MMRHHLASLVATAALLQTPHHAEASINATALAKSIKIDNAYKRLPGVAPELAPGLYAFTPAVMRFLEHFRVVPTFFSGIDESSQNGDQLPSSSPSLKLPDFVVVLHGRFLNEVRTPAHYNAITISVRTHLGVDSGQSIGLMRILVAHHDMDGAAQHTKNEAGFDSLLASLYAPILKRGVSKSSSKSSSSTSSSSSWWKSWRSVGVFGLVGEPASESNLAPTQAKDYTQGEFPISGTLSADSAGRSHREVQRIRRVVAAASGGRRSSRLI